MDADTLREHLDTLGVSEDCSDDALTQAYRDLVKVWHPDRFAHDGRLRLKAEEQLKRINNAYEWLRKYRRDTSSTRSRPSPDSSSSSTQQPGDVVFCANCGVSLRVPEGASYLRCPSCKHEQDRNGAPRPQRPPTQPDESPVDDTSETEIPRAPRMPNHPILPFSLLGLFLALGIIAIQARCVFDTAPTRVEATKGVEQAVDSSIASLREWAEQGNAVAQFNLGVMYANGQGVPKEDTQAVAWYRKAADQGVADAQYNLGLSYANGTGVPQDNAQAVAWYRKAADQGNANAQYNLGVAYANGRGVPQDDTQAVVWYRKAADQGDADAQYNLGLAYGNGRGVPQDDTQAVVWYRKAADQGLATAQNNLGLAYADGTGVPQDDTQAVVWYRKAADRGIAEAQYNLGLSYANGTGAPQDDTQAVAWFRKAADQGNAAAQYALGVMYANGQGVPKDDVVSYMWLNLAVSRSSGDEQGSYIRGRDEIAARLTPQQLANGQRMAREWQAALETPQSQPQFEQAPEPPIRSTRVALVAEGGTYLVPVQINGVLTLHFTVDSGASDVTIPADVVMTLYRTGTIRDEDFIGDKQYQLADGSIINSRTFRIRSLTVGSQTLTGVTGSVADIKGSLLLGQSFLSRFRSWAMDNETHELVLEPK